MSETCNGIEVFLIAIGTISLIVVAILVAVKTFNWIRDINDLIRSRPWRHRLEYCENRIDTLRDAFEEYNKRMGDHIVKIMEAHESDKHAKVDSNPKRKA